MKQALTMPNLLTMMALLGEQAEKLRPGNKATSDDIAAARGTATLVNSYLAGVKVAMSAAKQKGEQPNLEFLNLAEAKNSKQLAS
jgi:hypothetical protein